MICRSSVDWSIGRSVGRSVSRSVGSWSEWIHDFIRRNVGREINANDEPRSAERHLNPLGALFLVWRRAVDSLVSRRRLVFLLRFLWGSFFYFSLNPFSHFWSFYLSGFFLLHCCTLFGLSHVFSFARKQRALIPGTSGVNWMPWSLHNISIRGFVSRFPFRLSVCFCNLLCFCFVWFDSVWFGLSSTRLGSSWFISLFCFYVIFFVSLCFVSLRFVSVGLVWFGLVWFRFFLSFVFVFFFSFVFGI